MRASTDTFTPVPHWGLYGDASWAKLQEAASAHHLLPGSIDVVTGTTLERNEERFAILSARTTSGRNCFAVATGTVIARVICRIDSPLMLFTETDTCAACSPGRKPPLRTLTVLALVRSDVQSVISLYNGYRANVERVPAAGGVTAFNTSGARAGTTFTSLGPSNRVLSELHLRLARSSA
jgi:hypothetical protein